MAFYTGNEGRQLIFVRNERCRAITRRVGGWGGTLKSRGTYRHFTNTISNKKTCNNLNFNRPNRRGSLITP